VAWIVSQVKLDALQETNSKSATAKENGKIKDYNRVSVALHAF
jgi:hypothetical protein